MLLACEISILGRRDRLKQKKAKSAKTRLFFYLGQFFSAKKALVN
jgi:hypothetical protein